MATRYQIIQPNGMSLKLISGSQEERMITANELLSKWGVYCNDNWISVNHEDTFCGENKVKRFLNGLSYFLLLGNTEGIVTDYKSMMNGKREIPISSCPAQIGDLVYGTGSVLHTQEEDDAFKEAAREPLKNEPKQQRSKSMSEKEKKIRQIKKDCGYDCEFSYRMVDTENSFTYAGERFEIDASVTEYAPKHTALGLLYDMDKVVCVKSRDGTVRFYTQKYDPIEDGLVRKKDF